MKKTLYLFTAFLLFCSGLSSANNLTCQGKFINPITDICWSCVFPITLGGTVDLMTDGQENNNSSPKDWFCTCTNPARSGVNMSFWEPSHLVEVVRTPFCLVSLGGIDMGGDVASTYFGGSHTHGPDPKEGDINRAFWQVHWYKNPVIFWLEAVLDSDCLDKGQLDLGWLTELDPTWKYPELAFLQAPDSALFANPVAQAACAADCAKANFGFPFNQLFWCAGCHGSLYPLSGWLSSQVSPIQASKLMVARMQAKMHRDFAAWRTSGEDAICGPKLNPVMIKDNYKMAMTYPVPARKFNGKCCDPIGRSTLVRDVGKSFPYKGSQFAYQLFRKVDCCAAYTYN